MNPSSYMYPDAKRPLDGQTFVVPDSTSCPGYNHYPKGLENLDTYARRVGAERILDNMMHRDVVILLGEKDTRVDDPYLDLGCAADMQGAERLERGLNYISHMETFPQYSHKKNFDTVPKLGHGGDLMINSPQARKWIFGNRTPGVSNPDSAQAQ